MMNINILYEDNSLMVINKPAGAVVNRVETEKGETVEEWAGKRISYQLSVISYQSQVSRFSVNQSITGKPKTDKPVTENRKPKTDNGINSAFLSRSGIVHRLDKETSGCLIIAKTEEAFVDLQRQFRERQVKKEYSALVHGKVEPSEGTIRVPIARSHHDSDKFAVVVGGRISETGYRVISYQVKANQPLSSKPNQPACRRLERQRLAGRQLITNNQQQFSLLRIFPLTGRTHQIRVHFKYFGHPLVSDEKYGGSAAVEDRKWCPRIFLHAAKITFIHPVSKRLLSFTAPTPKDLEKIIKQLTI